MEVSVVIPTYGRPALLRRCLEAVLSQTLSRYEVIVVEDGAATLHGLSYPGLKVLATGERKGPAAARNLGWRAAAGEIIAFTDDDTVPEKDWLASGLAEFTPKVIAAAGRVVVPLGARPTDYERNESGLESADFVTANAFVRRTALEAVGGFHEGFTEAWREDSDLHFRLLDRCRADGSTFSRATQAVVIHPVRPAPWGISLRQQRKARFNALLRRRHPMAYRNHIEAQPPIRTYMTVAAGLTAVIALGAGARRLAMISGALWGLLTLQFLRKRLKGNSRRTGHLVEMAATSALIPFLSAFWRLFGSWRYRNIPPWREKS